MKRILGGFAFEDLWGLDPELDFTTETITAVPVICT